MKKKISIKTNYIISILGKLGIFDNISGFQSKPISLLYLERIYEIADCCQIAYNKQVRKIN